MADEKTLAPEASSAPNAPKTDAPQPDAPNAPKTDAPQPDAPIAPKTDAPKTDAPKQDAPKPRKSVSSRKRRRRIIRIVILLAVLAGGGYLVYRHFFADKDKNSQEILTDTVMYSSITAKVEGNGMTRAKNSETLTIPAAGTVREVMVEEGDEVQPGDPLFIIDSEDAQKALKDAIDAVTRAQDTVRKAQSSVQSAQDRVTERQRNVENAEKSLKNVRKKQEDLNVKAEYPGKLMDIMTLNPGDKISEGTVIAKIADDTSLRLTQYYSYAYEGSFYPGQAVQVSVPVLMSALSGTVDAVHMVRRITTEGTSLFSVDILVPNEGALTAGMDATATVFANGETVYPYEPGKLEYFRMGEVKTAVTGRVITTSLVNYLQVETGQSLVVLDGEDLEEEITTAERNLIDAQKNVEEARQSVTDAVKAVEDAEKTVEEAVKKQADAQKNLDKCNAFATIAGKVIGLEIHPGDEMAAGKTALTVSDTSTITVNAMVDEMNISYVKKGLPVDLDQWDTMAQGIVESVSLSSTVTNGVASYPMIISVDNADEKLQVNSNIRYTLIASQNDNCLVVPIQSVRTVTTEEGAEMSVVYVQGDRPANAVDGVVIEEEIPEGFWPVPVETGIQDSYNVEIKSGLEEGQTVFTQMQSTGMWE